jgi:hypothetical protein
MNDFLDVKKEKGYCHYFLILCGLVTCRNIYQNVNNVSYACIWCDMKDGLLLMGVIIEVVGLSVGEETTTY